MLSAFVSSGAIGAEAVASSPASACRRLRSWVSVAVGGGRSRISAMSESLLLAQPALRAWTRWLLMPALLGSWQRDERVGKLVEQIDSGSMQFGMDLDRLARYHDAL